MVKKKIVWRFSHRAAVHAWGRPANSDLGAHSWLPSGVSSLAIEQRQVEDEAPAPQPAQPGSFWRWVACVSGEKKASTIGPSWCGSALQTCPHGVEYPLVSRARLVVEQQSLVGCQGQNHGNKIQTYQSRSSLTFSFKNILTWVRVLGWQWLGWRWLGSGSHVYKYIPQDFWPELIKTGSHLTLSQLIN
jgi:hypothetical protein